MSEIVRADALRGFRELAGELGGDGEALLRASGIDPAALSDGDAYISFRRVLSAQERAATELNCPDFGMRMAGKAGEETLGPISVAMHSAETPRQAFAIAQRYMHFHNPSVVVGMRRYDAESDLVSTDLRMHRPPRAMQGFERAVAMLHRALQLLSGPGYRPSAVLFRHAPLSKPAVYRDVFGVTPEFNTKDNGLVVASTVLDALQPARNAQLRRIAEHFLESVTPPAAADDALAPRARIIVARLMRVGECVQADLARALGLHERTLQRRLKAEDTSFEDIRDDVRRELAQTYLAQRGIPLAHVAEMLGYAEPSALTRASQRWFGQAPREVRRRLAG